MSEKREKKPAHEVILEKLANHVKDEMELIKEGGIPSGFGYYRMEVLCQVLAEMVIPDDKIKRVAESLLGLAKEYRRGEVNIVSGLLFSTSRAIFGKE